MADKIVVISDREYQRKANSMDSVNGVGMEAGYIKIYITGEKKNERVIAIFTQKDEIGHPSLPGFLKHVLSFYFSSLNGNRGDFLEFVDRLKRESSYTYEYDAHNYLIEGVKEISLGNSSKAKKNYFLWN